MLTVLVCTKTIIHLSVGGWCRIFTSPRHGLGKYPPQATSTSVNNCYIISSWVIRCQKSFCRFLNMKISLQPVNQFGWNLANLLADSFLTNRVRIFLSFFVNFKLEYFVTGSANDLLSQSLTAYNKRTSALDKNLRHGVLVKRLSVKIVTLWLKKKDSLELVCMYCRTNSVKNSYFIRIVNEWNSLPNDFKESVSIFGIKHKVKSFLGNS